MSFFLIANRISSQKIHSRHKFIDIVNKAFTSFPYPEKNSIMTKQLYKKIRADYLYDQTELENNYFNVGKPNLNKPFSKSVAPKNLSNEFIPQLNYVHLQHLRENINKYINKFNNQINPKSPLEKNIAILISLWNEKSS